MNCPSRVDQSALENEGYNQNPGALDLHKRDDLNSRANLTTTHDHRVQPVDSRVEPIKASNLDLEVDAGLKSRKGSAHRVSLRPVRTWDSLDGAVPREESLASTPPPPPPGPAKDSVWGRASRSGGHTARTAWARIRKLLKFVGPGFMIAVAYIDPGESCSGSGFLRVKPDL